METAFHEIAAVVGLAMEAVAVLLITIGGLEAVYRSLWPLLRHGATQGMRRAAWLSFGRWLLLGLEFTLAADIVRSAISPTWDEIGQLAAIAVIRTFLNYFLERDLEAAGSEPDKRQHASAPDGHRDGRSEAP